MGLILNHGDAQKIHFLANVLNMSKIEIKDEDMSVATNQSGRAYPNFAWDIETIPGLSAYLMLTSSHGNGDCILCYTNKLKKFSLQAQHKVPISGINKGGNMAYTYDFLVKDIEASMKALKIMRRTVYSSAHNFFSSLECDLWRFIHLTFTAFFFILLH
jgi:hypothetical protein